MKKLIHTLVLGMAVYPLTIVATPLWTKTLACEQYTVTITENPQKVFNLKLVSSNGVINLSDGRQEETTVFIFKNDSIEYWVTTETLSAETSGVLEIYQNGQQISLHNCR